MKRYTLFSLILVLQGAFLYAQLVFPGAEGFGADHRSAYSGSAEPRILIVDSLLDTEEGSEGEGRGTLRWCLTRSYPRIILFEVGGTIRLERSLEIEDPYVFVAGQSAPSPGILLTTSSVVIKTDHVLLQHLSFRAGDDPAGSSAHGRDCIAVYTGSSYVSIDHCSLLWGLDENFSTNGMGEELRNITVSNCLIAQGLNYSISPDGAHSKGMLIAYYTYDISILKNLFAHHDDRNPLLSGGTDTEVINNIFYNAATPMVYTFHDDKVSESSVINNMYVSGYDWERDEVVLFNNIHSSSRVYLSGNTDTNNDWDYTAGDGDLVRVDNPPVSSGLVDILSREALDAFILDNAGSRPWERSEADQDVIDQYRNGTGRIVDCVDAEDVLYDGGTAVSGTTNTITLDAGTASDRDRAYERKSIEILGGTGQGQRRDVVSYNGQTRQLTVTPDWDVIPDGSSEYTMIVNCDNHAGGWRLLSSSQWNLDIPEDPHGDANSNGYTNLEEWLYLLNPVASLPEDTFESSFSIYPNPTIGLMTLEFFDSVPEARSLQLTSLSGAIHMLMELDSTNTDQSIELDLSQMQKGIYVLGVIYDDRVDSKKLVIL